MFPINTEVRDTTATHGGLTGILLNGIILERAHVDYTFNDLLSVRTGVFLTPYGIYNVDHGSPVRIVPRPPGFIISGLLPERQTGIELFGRALFMPWSLEYHAYVSNGRQLGAIDFDEDKALGVRLVLATRQAVGHRIRGYGTSPRTTANAALLVKVVARLRGSVSYVRASRVVPGVKVVARVRNGRVVAP